MWIRWKGLAAWYKWWRTVICVWCGNTGEFQTSDYKTVSVTSEISVKMAGRTFSIAIDGDEPETGGSSDRATIITERHTVFLNPQNNRVRAWETLIIIAILTAYSLDLFLAAFDSDILQLWIILYTCDVLYLIDIVMSFFRGYMKDGILIADSNKIKRHYLRTTFPIDLFTILPTDLIALAYPGLGSPRIWKLIANYRFANRVFRIYRIFVYFGE